MYITHLDYLKPSYQGTASTRVLQPLENNCFYTLSPVVFKIFFLEGGELYFNSCLLQDKL